MPSLGIPRSWAHGTANTTLIKRSWTLTGRKDVIAKRTTAEVPVPSRPRIWERGD